MKNDHSGSELSSFEGRLPKVNMIDRDDEVSIKADMPGVDKKDIDVSITDHTITIKDASKKQEKEEKGDYYRSEIFRGAFSRSMSLPAEVDIEHSTAEFKVGVIELNLPKMKGVHRRNINID